MWRVGPDSEPAPARLQLRSNWSGTFYQRPFARRLYSALSLVTSMTHRRPLQKARVVIFKTHSRHWRDRFRVLMLGGGGFMVRTCQLIEISLKMRNRFPGHLRGGRTKGPAQSPKLGTEFIFHLFRNVYLCYLASVQRKRIGYRSFNFQPMMKRYIDSGESWNLDHIVTPLTPLAPCHKGLVYGAHLKYIIERSEKKTKKH